MKTLKGAAIAAGLAAMLTAIPAQAQWGPGWGSTRGGTWGRSGWNDPLRDSQRMSRPAASRNADSREGKVEVTRFVSPDPAAAGLGKGPVSVQSESGDGGLVEASLRRTYEAAVIDALVGAGYDTLHPDVAQPQIAKLRISRQVLTPAEEEHRPVSGVAAMEVGTHGQSYGLGINVDLSKPRSALVSTRLDTQIIDRETGKVLWEAYATIATREGDGKWPDGMIATKLANALFNEFPKADALAPSGKGRAS